MPHDFLIRYAIAVGGRHEARSQAVWAERLPKAGLKGSLGAYKPSFPAGLAWLSFARRT